MLQEVMFCFIVVGVILSQIGMWCHISKIRHRVDAVFRGKSAEDIYYFINKKANVENTEQSVDNIEDK